MTSSFWLLASLGLLLGHPAKGLSCRLSLSQLVVQAFAPLAGEELLSTISCTPEERVALAKCGRSLGHYQASYESNSAL